MNPSFKKLSNKDYIISTSIQGHEILLSDVFEMGTSEFILLEILESTEGDIFLKIIGIAGDHLGNRYIIPKKEFENTSPEELSQSLSAYQH